jgi:hypothetical protein
MVDYGGSAWPRKHRRKGRGWSRKALLGSSLLALLLLLGGGTAAGLGYLGAGILPWQAQSSLAAAVQPVVEDPPSAAETGEDASAAEPEQTDAESAAQPVDERLAPVPSVDTYFDYFAVETLQNSGFKANVVYEYRPGYLNSGVTWSTDPPVGTMAPVGSTVTVYATPKDQPQIVQGPPPIIPPQPQIQPQPQVQPRPPV